MITDDVIMRTIIDLPDQQVAALASFCKQRKISRAEAVRQAVDTLLSESSLHSRETSFGAWAARGDSRAIVDQLREEWDR